MNLGGVVHGRKTPSFSAPLDISACLALETPSAVRIYKAFSRQILLVLFAAPRQRRRQLPARIELVQHELHELQVLWVLDLRFRQDGGELFLCRCAVERRAGVGMVV